MTLPNPASEGLHAALGFEPVGTYRDIGYKFGAWHDVAWTQKTLATPEALPASRHRYGRTGARTAPRPSPEPLRHGVVVDSVNVSVLP